MRDKPLVSNLSCSLYCNISPGRQAKEMSVNINIAVYEITSVVVKQKPSVSDGVIP